MVRIRKYIYMVLFLLEIVFSRPALANEITAIDFNGNIIGQVISTGMVISPQGENIGSITVDSLIINNDGQIIGGVVPQGVVIGNDNRFLGKIYGDGKVRSLSGKELGHVLPNGLVLDSMSNIIGSVLYPGIIYSADGTTIGRMNSAGLYTNLDGQEIGFVSANGFAYRKNGDEYILDGHLMSSKMVVSLDGQFIGSVAPTGDVVDFGGQTIGKIHANGYVYDMEGSVIGGVVYSGYAFDSYGNYLGVVSYNGQVVNNGNIKGYYRADGSIVNNENQVIGFCINIAATANDNNGHYLGRIVPGGQIINGNEIVGRVGAKGYVYNQENTKIGEIVNVGPVYDTLGHIKGQSLRNGTVISLKGSIIGFMRGKYSYDTNGTLIGGTTANLVAFDHNNKPLGSAGIDAHVKNGADEYKVSPFGYLFNADGRVVGTVHLPAQIFNMEGQPYSYVNPNGQLYGTNSDVIITQDGAVIGKEGYIGEFINTLYALGYDGNVLGEYASNNILLNNKGGIAYKIVPGRYVVESTQAVTSQITPIKGFSSDKRVALNIGGDLLGYADSNGAIFDLSGSENGKIGYNDYIFDNNNNVIGQTVGFATIINEKCSAIGVVNGRGDIINNRDVIIGRVLPNGQAISDVGSYIGYAVASSGLIDYNGTYAGTANIGKGVDINGKSLGCVNRKGQILDADNNLLYGIIENAPVIDFENNMIGYVLANGSVIDFDGQNFGYMEPNGNVVSKSKKNLGNVFKYKVAYTNDNKFLGMVQHSGEILDVSGNIIGKVNFDGSVSNAGEVIGYALYDFYVYDDNFITYGYLTKDGVVLSMVGSKLGDIDRGFVLDRNGQVIARGNRDYIVRDVNNNPVGELKIDGNVIDFTGHNVGYLTETGSVRDNNGAEIAQATTYQYYVAYAKQGSQEKPQWADNKSVKINDADNTENQPKTEFKKQNLGRKIVGIALSPEGDIIGNIYDDDTVIDNDGNHIGFRTPDGIVVDLNYNPIGVEEIKRTSASDMFIPANAFGKGNAYGIGTQPTNLGPGGGYGQGERYDPLRMQALAQLQAMRRQNIAPGDVAVSGYKPSSFTGYEEDGWPNQSKNISSWRVDMSEMILEDKPIPAVLARPVYASEGFGSNIPVTAIVERNVYAEEGRNIIIPAGSRVIGKLGGEGGGGNTSGGAVKIGITWSRLIRPDGSQFTFSSAQTADAQGRAGAIGYLDEQLLKKYSLPIVTSSMESALAYVMASGSGSTTTSTSTTEDARSKAADDARQNFIEQMNEIFEDFMQRKENIRAVTYIPAGTRIIIFANEDMWLNNEKRNQEKDETDIASNKRGLVDPDADSRSNSSSVTYKGNYNENVQPVSAGGQQRTNYNQPTNNNNTVYVQSTDTQQTIPASTDASTSGVDDDIPDLL